MTAQMFLRRSWTVCVQIIQVISKYMYIDTREMEFALESENDTMALVVNIPVVSVQHGGRNLLRHGQ